MPENLPNYDTWKTSSPTDAYEEYVGYFTISFDGEFDLIKSEEMFKKFISGVVAVLDAVTETNISVHRFIEVEVNRGERLFVAVVDVEATLLLPERRSSDQELDMVFGFANEIEDLIKRIVYDFGSVSIFVHPA